LKSSFRLDGLPLREARFCTVASQTIVVSAGDTPIPPEQFTSQDSFVWTDPNATLSVHKNGSVYTLVFPELAVFSIEPDTAQIHIYSSTDEATLSHLLLDQVLPRFLAWSGEIVIHAGAIETDGYGIAFLGESGHGKSSMTAGFLQAGGRVLSDDAITVTQRSEGIYMAGLYPCLRLWPRAVEGLSFSSSQTSNMAHYSTKRRVYIDDAVVSHDPVKLGALYSLQMGEGDSDISFEPLSQREVMMVLIEGSFRLDPTAHPQGQEFFTQIDGIKNCIKGYRLYYPKGYVHLPAVRAAIIAHVKETD